MLRDFSEDIILNISSFLLGEPHLYRIKRNPTLKAIQDKYKINYTEPYLFNSSVSFFTYHIMGDNLKPHTIMNKQNQNRVVNFINHYPFGIPYGEDKELKDFDEPDVELIDLDDDDYNIKQIIIEVHSEWDGEIYGEFFGDFKWFGWGKRYEERYVLDGISRNHIAKAFRMYAKNCSEWIANIKNSSINRNIKLTEFLC